MVQLLRRLVTKDIKATLAGGKSVLLLGPRQAGKSTLIGEILAQKYHFDTILLQDPQTRLVYEKEPGRLIREYQLPGRAKIIFIDEIQKVPDLFDSVQFLIDEHKKQFILTGSSARKLRRSQANLLPGRVILNYLDPLMWAEMGLTKESYLPGIGVKNVNPPAVYGLDDCLVFGSLPAAVTVMPKLRPPLLKSYATVYLEEEIRAEALSRNVGRFSSFLQLAAAESGGSPNFAKLSNQTGVSVLTIRDYFQILEDTLAIFSLPPFIKSIRRRIAKTPKYYFFDLGVRNALAQLPLTNELTNVSRGILFEHLVVLELFRRQRLSQDFRLYYWRTQSGLEVDVIIKTAKRLIPLEIKAARDIRPADVAGLKAFMDEFKVREGYVVSLDEKPYRLDEKITVVPWNYV